MRYHDITADDMLNGDGLRVVLWISGCSHHCRGCQNPVTWNPQDGLLFDEAAKHELFSHLQKEHISGLTLSGGDPLYEGNRADVLQLTKMVRGQFPDKTIWLYTGYLWEEIQELELMHFIDVCVDGRFEEELIDTRLWWKGSLNQRVIDVQKSIKSGSAVLYCSDFG